MDINHPRQLLTHWREEAARLDEITGQHPEMEAEVRIFTGQAALLRRCADQLESRLLWSGLT